MKILRTNFPYGLNEKSKYFIQGAPTGTNCYPIGRSGERNNRCHKIQNSRRNKISLKTFPIFLGPNSQ